MPWHEPAPLPAVVAAEAEAAALLAADAALDATDDAAEEAELAAEPVAEADALAALDAVVDAVPEEAELVAEEALDAQVAVVGRSVTPCGLHRFCAKLMTVSWSAALQPVDTQQARPVSSSLLAQMHLTSTVEQPPKSVPTHF